MKGSVHVAPRNNARDLEVRLNEDGSVGLKATFSSGQISRATLSGIQELTEILYGKKKVTTFEGCGLIQVNRRRNTWTFGQPSELEFYFEHTEHQSDLVIVLWRDLNRAVSNLKS